MSIEEEEESERAAAEAEAGPVESAAVAEAAAVAAEAGAEGAGPTPEAAPPASPARVAELEAEVAALTDRHLRARAEIENLRRRAERERQDALRYAAANFARDMIAVAENLRRAIASVPPEARDGNDLLKTLLAGVEMTERELEAAFQRHHIRRIEALGRPFNAELHQAVFEVEDAAAPAGTVVQEMASGYTIHDRLLRPAMVAVAKGGPPRDAGPPAPEAPGGGAAAAEADEGARGRGADRAYQEAERGPAEGAGRRYDGSA